MATVNLSHVYKIYKGDNSKEVTAVCDVCLDVQDREFVVLVGPSGCGKSTTLRMIAGLEEISKGQISISDRVVNNVPPKDRDIAMVFQNYALYPHMSVFDNMAFGLKLRKVPKADIRRRVHEAADILGIGELLERRPKALSGGQRQRVALGRAIVRQPKVFLFDEPLSNLDAKMRVQMRSEIINLHRQLDATMVYVTHDQVEAMTMGTRIVVMKDGFVQQIDSPMNIYDRPANIFVAGFLGSPPMNFFKGCIVRSDRTIEFRQEDGGPIILDLSARTEIAGLHDRNVTIGVRPEHVMAEKANDGLPLSGTAKLVEPMGAETHLHLHSGKTVLVSRTHEVYQPSDIGRTIGFRIDCGKLHVFDTASGLRIAGLDVGDSATRPA